jgi:uncharacterized protein HemX
MTEQETDNTAELTEEPGESQPDAAQQPARRPGWSAVLFVALLAVAALAASGWLYQQQQLAHQAFDQRLQSEVEALTAMITELRSSITARDPQLHDQVASMTRDMQSLRQSLGRVFEQLETPREQWTTGEIQQLLQLAVDQLQLAGNVDAALTALQAADQRIATGVDPALQTVREQIARDIASLQQVARQDLAGTSHRLQALADKVDTLQTKGTSQRSTTSPPDQQGQPPASTGSVWQQIGNDLSTLVRIRRIEQPATPLLEPEQQYFLRENIRLQLLAARLALLRGDRQIYRDSLLQAREWLLQYFDINQQASRWMLDELDQLADVDPRPDLPDISGSLRSLATATGAPGR